MGLLDRVRNYVFPTPDNPITEVGAEWRNEKDYKHNLRSYITPVQLQRIRHDIQMWREAIQEAEQAWYPHRVRMQRMYIDTVLSGHTKACLERRKDLTLLRDFTFKNVANDENQDLKKIFDKSWFKLFLEYALEARFFGYSLIALDDLIDGEFPNLTIIRRFNISPDRLNVTSYVYSLSGYQFLDPNEPAYDWHVWIPTPSNVGVSKIGYGLLYDVAQYEILARNLLGQNADAVELYGMPTAVGKSTKTEEEERGRFFQDLLATGSSKTILLDPNDEVEFIEAKSMGQGYKIYPDLEKRLEQKISKILLGHADALDSVPGKLGSAQGENSPVQQALNDKQMSDGMFLENVVNSNLIPKLIKLGFNIDQSYKFCFGNNQELLEERKREDANNQQTASLALTMAQAGLKMDAKYFEERTGIPTIEVAPKSQFTEKIANKLKALYK
jgi:hypothetical protein